MKKVIIRPNGSKKVQTIFEEETLAQQQFKDQCDVNKIMEKYKKGKPITHLNTSSGVYADLLEIPDYREALEIVRHAQDAFLDLPAKIRAEHENDPQKLIQWLQDPSNDDKAVELGLKTRPQKAQPVEVIVTNQAEEKPAQ